ncbi:MAG: hypothetical protein J6P44_05805 [Bacteroidales bacterium]|nr:hypothetical protein [Bacteroidales bacterium]
MNIKPDTEQFKLPDDYFENFEDKVIKKYIRRQKVRKIKIFSFVSCLGVAMAGLTLLINVRDNDIHFSEEIGSLKNTAKYTESSIDGLNNTEDLALAASVHANVSADKQTKSTGKSSKPQESEDLFTHDELDYLESYLNEDNFELVYNSIMR